MKPCESTDALISARNALIGLNLDLLFASGIDVTLHSYTEGKPDHMRRVTIHAEFFGPVRDALRVALQSTIERRKESLLMQLRDLNSTETPA